MHFLKTLKFVFMFRMAILIISVGILDSLAKMYSPLPTAVDQKEGKRRYYEQEALPVHGLQDEQEGMGRYHSSVEAKRKCASHS